LEPKSPQTHATSCCNQPPANVSSQIYQKIDNSPM
jgi:hypothetical protein